MLKDLWIAFKDSFNTMFDAPPVLNFMLVCCVLGSAHTYGSPIQAYLSIALAVVFVLLFLVRFLERLIIRESE